jgi:hypothetical protein
VGRSAARGNSGAQARLRDAVVEQWALFEKGGTSRILFEIGVACKEHLDLVSRSAFGKKVSAIELESLMLAVALHIEWCGKAKQATVCWILIGRQLEVAKDILVMIARMVWDERFVWSNVEKK